jgi:hypothetical protein
VVGARRRGQPTPPTGAWPCPPRWRLGAGLSSAVTRAQPGPDPAPIGPPTVLPIGRHRQLSQNSRPDRTRHLQQAPSGVLRRRASVSELEGPGFEFLLGLQPQVRVLFWHCGRCSGSRRSFLWLDHGAAGTPAPLRLIGVRPIDSSPVDGPLSSAHSGRNRGGRTIGSALRAGRAFARIPRKPTCGYAALKEPLVSEGGVLVGGVGPRSASITVAWSQARIRVSSTATGGACRLAW